MVTLGTLLWTFLSADKRVELPKWDISGFVQEEGVLFSGSPARKSWPDAPSFTIKLVGVSGMGAFPGSEPAFLNDDTSFSSPAEAPVVHGLPTYLLMSSKLIDKTYIVYIYTFLIC